MSYTSRHKNGKTQQLKFMKKRVRLVTCIRILSNFATCNKINSSLPLVNKSTPPSASTCRSSKWFVSRSHPPWHSCVNIHSWSSRVGLFNLGSGFLLNTLPYGFLFLFIYFSLTHSLLKLEFEGLGFFQGSCKRKNASCAIKMFLEMMENYWMDMFIFLI